MKSVWNVMKRGKWRMPYPSLPHSHNKKAMPINLRETWSCLYKKGRATGRKIVLTPPYYICGGIHRVAEHVSNG